MVGSDRMYLKILDAIQWTPLSAATDGFGIWGGPVAASVRRYWYLRKSGGLTLAVAAGVRRYWQLKY